MGLPIPLIGDMIQGGAGLLGSLFGFISNDQQVDAAREAAQMGYEATKYAADRNYASQMETNAANKWMVMQNNATQLQLQREMNEYNSAASQFARFKAAGLNPFMSMAGQTAGIQTTLPQTEAPQFQAPQLPSDYGSQIGNSYRMLVEALDPRIKTEAASQVLQTTSKLMTDIVNAKKTLSETKYQNIQNKYAEDIAHNQVIFGNLQNEVERTVVQRNLLEVALAGKELDAFDPRLKLQLALGSSQIALQQAQGNLSEAQAAQVMAQKLKTIAETEGIKVNNSLIRPLFDLQRRLSQSQVYLNYASAHEKEAAQQLHVQMIDYYKALGIQVKNSTPLMSALNSGDADKVKYALTELQSKIPEQIRKEYDLSLEIFERRDLPLAKKMQQHYDALIKRSKVQNARDITGMANDAINTYTNVIKTSCSVLGVLPFK